MRTNREFEVITHFSDGTKKNQGTFSSLDEVGKIRHHHSQVTCEEIDEMALPQAYTHIIEYRDDEYIYDQYWM